MMAMVVVLMEGTDESREAQARTSSALQKAQRRIVDLVVIVFTIINWI